MSKPVLFASVRPLERAENIKALWDKYKGKKEFVQLDGNRNDPVLADAKYKVLVTDEFVRRSPEVCIMIGHGIAGGKTFGLDQPYSYHTHDDARLITWVITTGELVRGIIARQSGVSIDKVLPLGMPRTDQYFKVRGSGRGKRTYLYAPTYRGYGEGEDPLDTTDFREIDELLNDDEEFIIKAHMLESDLRDPVLEYEHIKIVSNREQSAEYLIGCDVLITDYSSILFDAYLLNKPVVLFAKDVNQFIWHRGMYFKYPEGYSERFCDNETDLVRMIREADAPTEIERRIRKIVCENCDGHSTDRILELIKEENRQGRKK